MKLWKILEIQVNSQNKNGLHQKKNDEVVALVINRKEDIDSAFERKTHP